MYMYIDDLIFTLKNVNILELLRNQLIKKFSTKDLGKAKVIIKWEIT